ncbi:MAG TPA: ATPase, T2SS/T4P/T4SS family [Candidatus Paceibacterota bacterium]|nr:ATPase, T2SS/T4P/T4SS family [Candidatus Paceibacterota bacterium]
MAKGNKQVLIVEDNFFVAQVLSEKLTHQGFAVIHAENGADGVKQFKANAPDVVILDLPVVGKPDGWAILKDMREEDAKAPILVLFATNNADDIKKATELGATSYLIKRDAGAETIISTTAAMVGGAPVPAPRAVPKQKVSSKNAEAGPAAAKPLGISGPERAQLAIETRTRLEETLKRSEADISIISLVDDMMTYAFLARASDIHLEPFEESFLARMRVDGILNDVFSFAKALQPGIIARIKVLGGMRTDEHQAAQDGRFRMRIVKPETLFDVRVSIVPTYYGENAVLRLLAEQTSINSLEDLAFTDDNRAKIRHAVQTPYGMILATGPTGSGKTTTLYTILKELNTREVQIITLEDPIEYSLDGVDQIQVNTRTGLTFAAGLRSILRQDPNIIMVGEIRDEETASIAVNAALTGHKLLATLHTNDAATTLPRLLDMGVEPFLVASTVNVAIGQRLVRTICPHCKTPRRITDAEFAALKESVPEALLGNHREFFVGKGCDVCNHTGYFGRLGIYEILEMSDFIREAIMRRADAGEVKRIAVKNGMTTLLEDGFLKAVEGKTTIEEVLRVIHE